MPTTEADFLRAIAEQPSDANLRFVFADWLDDQGDPRADLVRVEQRCRALPAYSDEYWQLKPKRNALRLRCKSAFLEAMGYDATYFPVFSTVPDDWRSRWRLIREFTERWYQVEMPDVGRRGTDADALAEQIGRELSPSIVEWMAFTEDLLADERESAAEMLRDGRRIADFPEHQSVSLNRQAEGDVHWAVAYQDLTNADPPVGDYCLDYSVVEPIFALNEKYGVSRH